MVDVSAVALSGIYASEKRIAVAADNVANLQTPGFAAKDVVQSANAGGGVNAQVQPRSPATVPAVDNEGKETTLPNASADEEVVAAQTATYTAKANLKVLQVQKQLDKSLLDIQA